MSNVSPGAVITDTDHDEQVPVLKVETEMPI